MDALELADYWQEEARRYADNADYWRQKYNALAVVEPTQRKPLSEEEMLRVIDDELEGGSLLDVARAVEKAHGIS